MVEAQRQTSVPFLLLFLLLCGWLLAYSYCLMHGDYQHLGAERTSLAQIHRLAINGCCLKLESVGDNNRCVNLFDIVYIATHYAALAER